MFIVPIHAFCFRKTTLPLSNTKESKTPTTVIQHSTQVSSKMPEFERNPYGMTDAYDDALKHYGFKQGRIADNVAQEASDASPALNLIIGTGMPVPKRKAVPKRAQTPPPKPRQA